MRGCERFEGLSQRRALHEARAADGEAPEVGDDGPVIRALGADGDLAADHRGSGHEGADGDEVRRTLGALRDVRDPRRQRASAGGARRTRAPAGARWGSAAGAGHGAATRSGNASRGEGGTRGTSPGRVGGSPGNAAPAGRETACSTPGIRLRLPSGTGALIPRASTPAALLGVEMKNAMVHNIYTID